MNSPKTLARIAGLLYLLLVGAGFNLVFVLPRIVKEGDAACPIKGGPSIHFDFNLSRETAADKLGGRVGADPAAVTASNGKSTAPYGTPPPEMAAAANAAEPKKSGIFGGLFRGR